MLRFTSFTWLATATFAAFLITPIATKAQTTLTYTDHEPLGGMRTRIIKDVFFEELNKQSAGRITIDDHWDGKVSTGYDALGVIAKGEQADIGIVVPEYSAKQLPLHQLFKSFLIGPTGDKQIKFLRETYKKVPALTNELNKQGVVTILITPGYPVAFFANKPFGNLTSIKGQRWRTASFWHRDFLKNYGSVPVTMPWNAEIVFALQSGALNGLMVNIDSGYQLKAYEAAPYVIASRDMWLGHVYLLTMNKMRWDSLAARDKSAIRRAAEMTYKTMGSIMDSHYPAMIQSLRDAGATIHQLPRAEADAFAVAVKMEQVQNQWAAQQEVDGVKDVRMTLDKIRKIWRHYM